MSSLNILFNISGSIAAYKACFVISRLMEQGHAIQVICTSGAQEFIGAATLEGLTGRPTLQDIFTPGEMMGHIHLTKWAHLSVLCPASANTINRLASGSGDDLVSALFLAHDLGKQPYIIVPAMNQAMWRHPATRSSVQRLQEWGCHFVMPVEGRQACGDVGPGRMAEPDLILHHLTGYLQQKCAS
jgi:phosphopantothenoylcysteine decarboxylase/phosphopantothenate--cysteine ligase